MSGADLMIVAGARTPFVRAGDMLADEAPLDLARQVIADLLQGRPRYRGETELLLHGCDRNAPGTTDPARLLALRSGLLEDTPGRSATGPAAGLEVLADLIERREDTRGSGLFIASAAGSSSAVLKRRKAGLVDEWSGRNPARMAEQLAVDLDISRHELDDHAARSRIRARNDGEGRRSAIVPIVTRADLVGADRVASIEEDVAWLARLKPLCGPEGRVTPGNTAIPADGAAALLLARRRSLPEGVRPLGRLRGVCRWAGNPKLVGPAALGALAGLMENEGLVPADLDRIEIHEGFASDVLACQRLAASPRAAARLRFDGESPGPLPDERINPTGGAIALGHAGAASGFRMLLALVRGLNENEGRLGAITMATGGGQALALLIEKEGE